MIETAHSPDEAADIIGRIMAEMEEVFGLIHRPLVRDRQPAATPEPDTRGEPRLLAA